MCSTEGKGFIAQQEGRRASGTMGLGDTEAMGDIEEGNCANVGGDSEIQATCH